MDDSEIVRRLAAAIIGPVANDAELVRRLEAIGRPLERVRAPRARRVRPQKERKKGELKPDELLREIAEAIGCSHERVRQLEASGMRKMRRAFAVPQQGYPVIDELRGLTELRDSEPVRPLSPVVEYVESDVSGDHPTLEAHCYHMMLGFSCCGPRASKPFGS